MQQNSYRNFPVFGQTGQKTVIFLFSDRRVWANSADQDQTAPREQFDKARKKIPVFQVTLEKKMGSVGRKNFFFLLKLFF